MCTLRVASLFAGCGGTDIGVEGGFYFLGEKYGRHPARLIYANDFDEGACNIFDDNFSMRISRKDIRIVDASQIPDHDILTAGFPCQSFSIVAQNPPRLGIKDSEKGALFEEVCRILRARQPKGFICENVKGILSANNSKAFPVIMESLRNCGYHVIHFLLNSYHYGVPQRRERVFIIGFKEKAILESFCPPVPVERHPVLSDVVFDENEIAEKYYFSARAVEGMRKAKKEMNKGRIQNLQLPCGTLGAHLAKVSLNSTDPVLCVNGRFRRFTPREVARIQSFPDSYKLSGPESKQYKALGNAVPPVLAWHVMDSLVKALGRVESDNNTDKVPCNREFSRGSSERYPSTAISPTNSSKHFIQMTLFEPNGIYVVHKSPVTLIATFRKKCMDWIIEKNRYNYPVTDDELNQHYELLAVRKLVLKHKKDKPLYFSVKGYSIVTKSELKDLDYKTSKNHPARTKYILYFLEKLNEPIPEFTEDDTYIVGKGLKD
jgi:DNA (cytosine-5)-methyltransferase 1